MVGPPRPRTGVPSWLEAGGSARGIQQIRFQSRTVSPRAAPRADFGVPGGCRFSKATARCPPLLPRQDRDTSPLVRAVPQRFIFCTVDEQLSMIDRSAPTAHTWHAWAGGRQNALHGADLRAKPELMVMIWPHRLRATVPGAPRRAGVRRLGSPRSHVPAMLPGASTWRPEPATARWQGALGPGRLTLAAGQRLQRLLIHSQVLATDTTSTYAAVPCACAGPCAICRAFRGFLRSSQRSSAARSKRITRPNRDAGMLAS